MATIGSMIVNVLANTSGFVNGMRTVRGELRTVKAEAAAAQSAVAAFGGLKSMLAGLGVGISATAVTRMLGNTADEIDRLVKVSDRLGVTTENLRGLEYGAALAGVSSEELSSALGFMTKQLAEAAHGGGKAKAVISELGLSAKALASMTPDEALLLFARRLSDVKDESEKVRIAMRLFGNAGVPLLTLLNEGEGAIKGYMAEARKLGLTYSKEEADKVVAFNDAWEKLAITMGSFSKDVVIDVTPVAIQIVKDLQDMLAKTPDVRTDSGKPAKAGEWLGMWYLKEIEDFIVNDRITGYGPRKKRGSEVIKVLPDGTRVRRGYAMDPTLEAPAFSQKELDESRKKLDPRFRPGGPGDAAAGNPVITRKGVESIVKSITSRMEGGVDMVTQGWKATGRFLSRVDDAGESLGKQMLKKQLIWELRGRPSKLKDDEAEAKKKAAAAEVKLMEERRKQIYDNRFRSTQPTPTAPSGSAAASEMVRQSQQQAAQLKATQQATEHLRDIKNALTNPTTTGL